MELRHLRYFAAVADEAHMGRAAARLRVAQSALSRQLQDLEREVGAALFERHPRGVRLTPAGEAFLAHARAALASAEAGARAARLAAGGEAGLLRVAPPDFGARVAPHVARALARFRAERPRVEVALVPLPWVAHVEALLEGRLDVGFALAGAAGEYPPALAAARIGDEPLAWALLPVAHPLAARRELTLAELATAPMVLSERAAIPALHDRVTAALARAGALPRVVSAPAAWAAVTQLVAAGAGWCPVVASAAESPPAGTVAVPVPELAAEVALELHVLRRRDGGALARAFAADVVACVQEASGRASAASGAGASGAGVQEAGV